MLGKVNEYMSIYQITVKARWGTAVELRNIHHYEFFGYVPDATQLQEFVDGVDSVYKTDVLAYYPNEITVYGYDVRRVDIGDLPTVEFLATAGSWTGSSGATPLPTQNAALTTFKAPTTFPRTTRTYHFPFSEAALDTTGELETVVQTGLNTWGNNMLEISITGGLNADKVAVSYGGDPRAVTDDNEVETVSTSKVYATQRRRRKGVGI